MLLSKPMSPLAMKELKAQHYIPAKDFKPIL